jgi:cysteine desulfurase
MQTPVYLDNHASTKVDPRVLHAMLPWFTENYGNPASRQHAFGWKAEAAVETARGRVARLIGAEPKEVIFTSGATESINLAIKGSVYAGGVAGSHIIISAIEHRAVLDTCRALEREGAKLTVLPVDHEGLVDPASVAAAITGQTVLVSIMAANNEIGTLQPVEEIAGICAARGIPFHTDAAQMAGHLPVDVAGTGVVMLSGSAHKMNGPKGAGYLCIRGRNSAVSLVPQIDGGGHERGLRSGTLDVPAIVGLGEAAELALREMEEENVRIAMLRDRLVEGICSTLPGVTMNGHATRRLPNNASLTFSGTPADRIMMAMKDVAVSAGSACSSAEPGPSHVLLALGMSREDAQSTLRFGLGRFTTEAEIVYTIGRVVEAVATVRRRHEHLEHA